MALALSTLLPIFNQITVAKKKTQTAQKMERVINSLGTYMVTFNDVPCPGKPDAAALGGVFGEPALDCITNPASGIVPFRALGLRESEVMDGWGNYFTYRISPVFKVSPHDPATPANTFVHSRCRTDNTNPSTPNWVVSGTNAYPHKARLCCQSTGAGNDNINTDIQILTDYDGNGTFSNLIQRPRDSYDTAPGNFQDINTPNAGDPGDFTAIAIVLVSHGPNGHGAMIKGQTVTNRYLRTDVDAASAEAENADADNIFQIVPESRAQGVNYYDDIVLWRTNDTLYAETTGRSCGTP